MNNMAIFVKIVQKIVSVAMFKITVIYVQKIRSKSMNQIQILLIVRCVKVIVHKINHTIFINNMII